MKTAEKINAAGAGKKILFGMTAALFLALTGCASTPGSKGGLSFSGSKSSGRTLQGVPNFVNDAYKNASEDNIVGIGAYKVGTDMAKMGKAKTFAETRARADISRQLNSIVRDMVTDYTAASELDPDAAVSFQEEIVQNLSKSELKGAKIIRMELDNSGVLWLVMEYSKSAAIRDVDQAANAARLAVPAAAAFNALERMNTAFDKEAGGGPIPVSE
ncbi:MAG: hypothetical protein LBC27_02180 [Spirochaetaceae bacterium]|nr:hypothetical protein [Spirochaetaceae bacterium]